MNNLKLYVDGNVVAETKDIKPLSLSNSLNPNDVEVVSYDGNKLILKNFYRSFEFNPKPYPGMEEKLSGLKPGDRLKLKYLDETA